jgi:hypothetical protein
MKITAFCDVTPCTVVDRYQCFYPEGIGYSVLRNVGDDLSYYTTSHPRDSNLCNMGIFVCYGELFSVATFSSARLVDHELAVSYPWLRQML